MQRSSGSWDSASGSPSSSFPSVPQPLSLQKEALVALEARKLANATLGQLQAYSAGSRPFCTIRG